MNLIDFINEHPFTHLFEVLFGLMLSVLLMECYTSIVICIWPTR